MIEDIYHEFTRLPAPGTPAAQLTDRDKVALAIAAGVEVVSEVEITHGRHMLRLRTVQPIGVADRGDGGYIVAVRTGRPRP